jgi:hypothetical protein
MSCHQNAEKKYNTKTVNRSFQNVAKFQCLGMAVTNQNLIKEEISSRLNLVNAWCHSVENLSYSRVMSKNKS